MFQRWRRDFKQYWNDLTKTKDTRDIVHDFKGKKFNTRKVGEGPTLTRQKMANFNVDEEHKMFSRSVRLKAALWGIAYVGWFVGATLFIMNRLRGDDLETMIEDVNLRQRAKRQLENIKKGSG